MRRIAFQKELAEAIVKGQKVTTMRFGKTDYSKLIGQKLLAITGNRYKKDGATIVGELLITDCCRVTISNGFLKGQGLEYLFYEPILEVDNAFMLAEREGFKSFKEMDNWFYTNLFCKHPNDRSFEGWYITFKYTPIT